MLRDHKWERNLMRPNVSNSLKDGYRDIFRLLLQMPMRQEIQDLLHFLLRIHIG